MFSFSMKRKRNSLTERNDWLPPTGAEGYTNSRFLGIMYCNIKVSLSGDVSRYLCQFQTEKSDEYKHKLYEMFRISHLDKKNILL